MAGSFPAAATPEDGGTTVKDDLISGGRGLMGKADPVKTESSEGA